MPIFGRSLRKDLKQAREKLDGWLGSYDHNAFPQLVANFRGLKGEVDDLLGGFTVEEIPGHRLLRRIGELENQLTQLTSFKDTVNQATREVQQIKDGAGKPGPVDTSIEAGCQVLLAGLQTLGGAMASGPQLAKNQSRLDGIVRTSRVLRKAAALARQADKINKKAEGSSNNAAVMLDIDLRSKLQELAGIGEDSEAQLLAWIEELEEQVREVEQQIRHVPDYKPDLLSKASSRLKRCEGWSRLLDRDKEDLRDLKDRMVRAEGGWQKLRFHPDKIATLANQVEEKYKALAEDARQRRETQLEQLTFRVSMFEQVCQGGADLHQALDKLSRDHTAVQGPADHERWGDQYELACQKFSGDASAYQYRLEERRDSKVEQCQLQITEVEQRPLSEHVGRQLSTLKAELEQQLTIMDTEALLRALQRLDLLGAEIEALRQRAEEEMRSLEQQRVELEQRWLVLHETGQKLDVTIEDLQKALNTLQDPEQKLSLDEVQQRTGELALRLDQAEQGLIGTCQLQYGAIVEALERGGEILARMGPRQARAQDTLPTFSDGGPEAAGKQLLAARVQQDSMVKLLEDAEAALEGKLAASAMELKSVDLSQLQRDHQEDLQDLLETLTSMHWRAEVDLLDRLDQMQNADAEFAYLQEQLQRERMLAEDTQARINELLTQAAQEGLTRYNRSMFERLNHLLHGVPQNPVSWKPVLVQFEMCEVQLLQLIPHCRRVAAAEVQAGLARLREMLKQRQGDRAWMTEAQGLMKRLPPEDARHLPDKFLRRKLLRLVLDTRRS